MRRTLRFVIVAALVGCRSTSPGSPPEVSVGALIKEYHESVSAARNKYDGKEISVRGIVPSVAVMPVENADQGEVSLIEAGEDSGRKLACWFSREQAAEFSKVKSGQQLTIKGVFTGEFGVELKFCRIVDKE
jgi:hypothetical protein